MNGENKAGVQPEEYNMNNGVQPDPNGIDALVAVDTPALDQIVLGEDTPIGVQPESDLFSSTLRPTPVPKMVRASLQKNQN